MVHSTGRSDDYRLEVAGVAFSVTRQGPLFQDIVPAKPEILHFGIVNGPTRVAGVSHIEVAMARIHVVVGTDEKF